MLDRGKIQVDGTYFDYTVGHYEENKVYGIGHGKIEYLFISSGGKGVCYYDQVWYYKPESDVDEKAMNILLEKFN